MSKTKILTYLVIILVVINLSVISFFLITKTSHRGMGMQNGPRKIIIEKLHLDNEQQEKYVKLIAIHRQKIESTEKEIRKNKRLLYQQLTSDFINLKTKDSLIKVLGNLQIKIENTHFDHFQELKKICKTPQQIEDYRELTLELGRLFSG